MIQNIEKWHTFELAWAASQKPDYAENLRLLEDMYLYARKLGKFSAEDAMEGIEKNIHLAGILNRVCRTS